METNLEYYLSLPDDALYHVCEQMDINTLDSFVKSNKRFNLVCSPILNDKKKIYYDSLANLLTGYWVKCIDDIKYGTELLEITINMYHLFGLNYLHLNLQPSTSIYFSDDLFRFSLMDHALFPHQFSWDRLDTLSSTLIKEGFRKINEDEIFAIKIRDEPMIFVYLPKKLDNILGFHDPEELVMDWDDDAQEYLFQSFGIEPGPDFDTRYYTLIERMAILGKIIQCN